MDNFDRAMAILLDDPGYEKGNDDDPHDNGGRTSRGITQAEYDIWRRAKGLPSRDVWTAPLDEIQAIYRASYWVPSHAEELPAGLDLAYFDAVVNSGKIQATKWLQRALGVKDDGVLGPITLAAAKSESPLHTIVVMSRKRLSTLKTLHDWAYYGNGWTNRVEGIRKIASNWAAAAEPPPTS